jgi:hypothetical protein
MAVTWITGEDTNDPGSPHADAAAEAASWVLYKLTAEKYPGIRTTTEWYGLESARCNSCEAFGLYDAWISDNSFSFPHRHLAIESQPSVIKLRGRPAHSITEVEVDGETLDPSQYALWSNAVLGRVGETCWDFNRGVTVTYKYGINPPELGRIAAIRLANEIILSIVDLENCSLPDRVTAVTRQGVSYTVLDPQTFLQDGRTGMYEIDLFIKTANPDNARKRPKIFSPDRPRGRRYN